MAQIILDESAIVPGTPSAGKVTLYAKTDGLIYSKDDAGVETVVGFVAPLAVTAGGTGRLTGTTAYGLIAAGTTATAAQQTLAAGSAGQVLTSGGASALPAWVTAVPPANGGTGIANNAAMTVTGSGNYAYTRTLTGVTNVTFPTSGTLAATTIAQNWTAAQTFRATNAIRSEAAATQDAIVLAGRAGGTSSYAVSITPPTLAGNVTLTLPAVTGTVAILGANTFTGAQALGNNNLTGIKTASFTAEGTISGTTGAQTVDWTAAQNYKQTEPTGAITYTFTAPPGVCHLQLRILSDGTSTAYTHVWPASVKWMGSTWAAAANKNAIINFWYDGTNYWAMGANEV